MPTIPAFLSARAMRWLNVAAAVWCALWIGLAAFTAYEVNALRTLSDTVVKAGVATESAGEALEAVGAVPLIGSRVGPLGVQAVAAGRSAVASGASSRGTIDRLAILLGIVIALVPTVPLLALYVPLQLSWRRDRRAVQRAVAMWDGEPGLDEFLAERAIVNLSYQELRRLFDGNTDTFEARDKLAAAELHRLGLDR